MQVAEETGTPVLTLAGGGAIVEPMTGPRRWMFKMPPSEVIPLQMILDDMRRSKKAKLAIVAVVALTARRFSTSPRALLKNTVSRSQ